MGIPQYRQLGLEIVQLFGQCVQQKHNHADLVSQLIDLLRCIAKIVYNLTTSPVTDLSVKKCLEVKMKNLPIWQLLE